MPRTFCLLAVAAATLCGCATGITVTRLQPDQAQAAGNPWNLGMTQFKITITRHVVGCGAEAKAGVEVLATSSVILDPEQRYVLESNGWWATSDITSNLAPSGVSTGLNASSTDASAAVLSSAIGAVAQVAIGAAAAGAPAVAGAAPPPPPSVCKKDIQDAVEALHPNDPKRPSLKDRVDSETAELAAATAKVTRLTTQAQADKSLRKALVDSIEQQGKIQERLTADQTQLADFMDKTTDTQVVLWPRTGKEFSRSAPFRLDRTVFDKWFTSNVDPNTVTAQLDVRLALYRQSLNSGRWELPASPPVNDTRVGVPVRLAAVGRLLACVGRDASGPKTCPESLEEVAARDKQLIATDAVVLQLGPMYTVPLTGGTLRSQTAVVAMDANGLPTLIQVSEKVAAAAALAAAAKDAATQVAALPAQVSAAQLARTKAKADQLTADAALSALQTNGATQAETGSLAAQAALLNARSALEEARAKAGLPAQTARVENQTAMVNAQIALLNAQANRGVIDKTSVIGAQTSLLNAQAAQINAAAALVKAQQVATP